MSSDRGSQRAYQHVEPKWARIHLEPFYDVVELELGHGQYLAWSDERNKFQGGTSIKFAQKLPWWRRTSTPERIPTLVGCEVKNHKLMVLLKSPHLAGTNSLNNLKDRWPVGELGTTISDQNITGCNPFDREQPWVLFLFPWKIWEWINCPGTCPPPMLFSALALVLLQLCSDSLLAEYQCHWIAEATAKNVALGTQT
jgi:hypothetical protein